MAVGDRRNMAELQTFHLDVRPGFSTSGTLRLIFSVITMNFSFEVKKVSYFVIIPLCCVVE